MKAEVERHEKFFGGYNDFSVGGPNYLNDTEGLSYGTQAETW